MTFSSDELASVNPAIAAGRVDGQRLAAEFADGLGWFADTDQSQAGEFVWQPCLQTDTCVVSVSTWFRSEADCLKFIRDEIIGWEMAR